MRKTTTNTVVIATVQEVDENDQLVGQPFTVKVSGEIEDDAEILRQAQFQTGQLNIVLLSTKLPLSEYSMADLNVILLFANNKCKKYTDANNELPEKGSYIDKMYKLWKEVDTEISSRIEKLLI